MTEKSIKQQFDEVYLLVVAEIEYGEAFYDGKMLDFFFHNLDELKRLGQARYEKNKKDAEEDE